MGFVTQLILPILAEDAFMSNKDFVPFEEPPQKKQGKDPFHQPSKPLPNGVNKRNIPKIKILKANSGSSSGRSSISAKRFISTSDR
jgi:hypothetical protein